MKPTSNILVVVFAFISIASIECAAIRSGSKNDKWHNLPSYFKRSLWEWPRNNSLNFNRMKSLALELTPLRSYLHRLTTPFPHGGVALIKAELRIEFYGISNKTAMQNQTYFVDIYPMDIALDLSPVKSSSIYIDEQLVELTFDVTDLYNASKNENLDVLRFSIKLLRGNRRTEKTLSKTTMKAFIILYDESKDSSFLDAMYALRTRFKRSRDINIEANNTPNSNSTVGLDVNVEELCHKVAEECMDFGIHPSYYRTSDCVLELPLSDSLMQTDLNRTKRGLLACCVPTDYDSLTMMFEDTSNDGRPVMSKFNDKAAKDCGCRLT